MPADPVDSSCLNAAERNALALLAEGHTVKSIAVLTDRSEAAINERLRDARRKTGIGSSRELARLLRTQENRDEQIGVAGQSVVSADAVGPAGGLSRRSTKVLFMMTVLVAAGALSLGIFSTLAPQTVSPPDPLIDSVVGSTNETPPALRQRFLAEPRDPAWASRSEAAIAAAYRAIGGLAPDLRIRCATTLCEVVGQSTSRNTVALGWTMQALQGKGLMDRLASNGLYSPSASFGGANKTYFRFVAYWSSAKP